MSQDDQAQIIGRLALDRKSRQDQVAAISAKLKQIGLDLHPITEGLRNLDPMRAKSVKRAFDTSHWLTASLPEILGAVNEYIQLCEQLSEDDKSLKPFGL